MNWAKGRATKGRGSSFKGALQYVLHDKDADTAERVGFVELRNLATDEPKQAWREMMALCDAADDLKQRAGIKATGRKLSKPVYAFTLNWHEADKPDPAHMQQTATSALEALGMDHLQAVIVEHTDRPHRHVHVIVNLADPDTGKAVSLSNDAHKLDRWADNYEVTQGVIRSPDRRAKFHALDNGMKPPKRPLQAKSREEWEATRTLKGQQAKERAAEIRAAYAAHVAKLKATQGAAHQTRRAEAEKHWNGYKADRKATRDRYQPFIDAIYKSKRKAPPHPSTEQALRDLEETAEWKEFGRQQFRQRRLFNARESSLLGVIGNAVRLHHGNRNAPGMPGMFKLVFSRRARQQQFQRQMEGHKQALRTRQAQRRQGRADTLRASCRLELSRLSETYQKERAEMLVRHAGRRRLRKPYGVNWPPIVQRSGPTIARPSRSPNRARNRNAIAPASSTTQRPARASTRISQSRNTRPRSSRRNATGAPAARRLSARPMDHTRPGSATKTTSIQADRVTAIAMTMTDKLHTLVCTSERGFITLGRFAHEI